MWLYGFFAGCVSNQNNAKSKGNYDADYLIQQIKKMIEGKK